MATHLIIPDSHSHPDFHNKRYDWAGRLAADIKPDTIIDIGDWADMPSLCSYDFGTRGYEGKRYHKDVASAVEARERFNKPLQEAKKKMPRRVSLIGNHEQRISKAISADAAHLEGVISLDDLQHKEYGWERVDYDGSTPGVVIIDGVAYAHYFVSGVMGRPISGERPAHQLVQKQFTSCVQGHTHTTDYCVRGTGRGNHLHGLVVGVYQDYWADYAGNVNDIWWKGVIVLRDVENGQYDPQWISLAALKREYSK